MWRWKIADVNIGVPFPRYWHPWMRARWKPLWLYLPCLRVWRDS